MNLDSASWHDMSELDPAQEYRALRNGLRRARGFSLFFVQCSPAQGTQIIERIRQDLPKQKINVLSFDQAIDDGNLYQRVSDYLQTYPDIDILFIRGLEYSLLSYEETQREEGNLSNEEIYSYSWKAVPRLLGNLNLRREKFRDDFPVRFVFLLPLFALKYVTRRAPDFFDWRSGVFEFPAEPEDLEQESLRIVEGTYEKYVNWTQAERDYKIADIQAYIDEPHQASQRKARLYFELGLIFAASKMYQAVIASFDKVLELDPENHFARSIRGDALFELEHYEAAVKSFDKALEIDSGYAYPWSKRGGALYKLERYEETITSCEKALEIDPSYIYPLAILGGALYNLEHYEKALESYDKALEIDSNNPHTWAIRGSALCKLERYEEAIASYDKALEIEPRYDYSWAMRGDALCKLERYEEAVESYDKALKIDSNYASAWRKRGDALYNLEHYEKAVESYDKALKIDSSYAYPWAMRGDALCKLERYEEAIASYDRALELRPSDVRFFYGKACCYGLQKLTEIAVDSLKQAIDLNPQCREMAKTDSDFDSIRNDDRFQALINETQHE